MITYASALALLKQHGQEHLLRFWDELDAEQRNLLLSDIASVDFELIARLHREQVLNPEIIGEKEIVGPLRGEQISGAGRAELEKSGTDLLRAGLAAAFLVAGGQGTQ